MGTILGRRRRGDCGRAAIPPAPGDAPGMPVPGRPAAETMVPGAPPAATPRGGLGAPLADSGEAGREAPGVAEAPGAGTPKGGDPKAPLPGDEAADWAAEVRPRATSVMPPGEDVVDVPWLSSPGRVPGEGQKMAPEEGHPEAGTTPGIPPLPVAPPAGDRGKSPEEGPPGDPRMAPEARPLGEPLGWCWDVLLY